MKTAKIGGKVFKAPAGAIAWKYADPTEGARWVMDQDDYDDVYREDPRLLAAVTSESQPSEA